MDNKWTADVGDDSSSDCELFIELSCDGEPRIMIRRSQTDELIVRIYPHDAALEVPAGWLGDMISGAEKDLPKRSAKRQS